MSKLNIPNGSIKPVLFIAVIIGVGVLCSTDTSFPATEKEAKHAFDFDGRGSQEFPGDPDPSQTSTEFMGPDLYTGTYRFNIPIKLPPLRRGLNIPLLIQYSSADGNGILGIGWDLRVGAIERETKFGLNYEGSDFIYSGPERRVALFGINAGPLSSPPTEFREKFESRFLRYSRIQGTGAENRLEDYWLVNDKKGVKYFFGVKDYSKTYDPENPFYIAKWHLDKIQDPNGNVTEFVYSNDQGKTYLTCMLVNGENLTNQFFGRVEFIYEIRPDIEVSFRYGYKEIQRKRLKEIEIFANGNCGDVDGIRVGKYDFRYQLSGETDNSLLEKISYIGSDGSSTLNPIQFSYTSAPGDSISRWKSEPWNLNHGYILQPLGKKCLPADVNGDGLLDLACKNFQSSWTVYIPRFLFPRLDFQFGWNGPGFGQDDLVEKGECKTLDVNGDGSTDIACVKDPGNFLETGISTKKGWIESGWFGDWDYLKGTLQGDFNGDGKIGWVRHVGNGSWLVTQPTESGWKGFEYKGDGPSLDGLYESDYCIPGDFDGNNATDMACVVPNTGNWVLAFFKEDTIETKTVRGPSVAVPVSNRCLPGDFNGDSKTDIVCQQGDSPIWNMALSTGDSFLNEMWGDGPVVSLPIIDHCVSGDLDGDKKHDLACKKDFENWHLAFSRSTKWKSAIWEGPSFNGNLNDWCFSGELTGDNRLDLICSENQRDWFYLTPELSHFHFPDLLRSVTNPTGGKTYLDFKSTVQWQGMRVTIPEIQFEVDYLRHTQLPLPIPVLESIQTDDGNGVVSTNKYDYYGGYYHVPERDFRGFNRVEIKNAKKVEEIWFHQGNDFQAMKNNPNVEEGFMKGRPYRRTVSDLEGHLLRDELITYKKDDSPPYFNPPSKIQKKLCNGRDCTNEVKSEYSYDVYGNLILIRSYGDTKSPDDDLTFAYSYLHEEANWMVGLLQSESVYLGLETENLVWSREYKYDDQYSDPLKCNDMPQEQPLTKGNVSRIILWLANSENPEIHRSYDQWGNPKCLSDPMGNRTIWEFDSSNRFVKKQIHEHEQVIEYEYYGIDGHNLIGGVYGQIGSITEPNRNKTVLKYDPVGRIKEVLLHTEDFTRWEYVHFGDVGEQHIYTRVGGNDQRDFHEEWSYIDGWGRVFKKRQTGPHDQFIETQQKFNRQGLLKAKSLPYFSSISPNMLWVNFRYDSLGRIISKSYPDSTKTIWCYSGFESARIDRNHHKIRGAYDSLGRLVEVNEYIGAFLTCDPSFGSPYSQTKYKYNALNNLELVEDSLGNLTRVKYDSLGRKVALDDPNLGKWTYRHDLGGNLIEQKDARGNIIYFSYDRLNRMIQKDVETPKPIGLGDVVLIYDKVPSRTVENGMGRLVAINDHSGKTEYNYDEIGRVKEINKQIDSRKYQVGFFYDSLGRISQIKYPDQYLLNYHYDGPFLAAIGDESGPDRYVSYSNYNPFGSPETVKYGNGTTTQYTFYQVGNPECDNATFRLCKIVASDIDGNTFLRKHYTYDNLGNIINIGTLSGNDHFTYDELNRLTSSTRSPDNVIEFQYDQIGNIVFNSKVGKYTYNKSGPNAKIPHAVISADGKRFSYDKAGNLDQKGDWKYLYDADNRLVKINPPGFIPNTEFIYDGQGRRVLRKQAFWTPDKVYVGNLFQCSNDKCKKMIFAGTTRVAEVQGQAKILFYHNDKNSSLVGLTNAEGKVLASFKYDPFGNTYVQENGDFLNDMDIKKTVHRFGGMEYDAKNKLYYTFSRFYDSLLGRFTSPDKIGPDIANPQSLNRYSYAHNRPITMTDSSGFFPQEGSTIKADLPEIDPINEPPIDPEEIGNPGEPDESPSMGRMESIGELGDRHEARINESEISERGSSDKEDGLRNPVGSYWGGKPQVTGTNISFNPGVGRILSGAVGVALAGASLANPVGWFTALFFGSSMAVGLTSIGVGASELALEGFKLQSMDVIQEIDQSATTALSVANSPTSLVGATLGGQQDGINGVKWGAMTGGWFALMYSASKIRVEHLMGNPPNPLPLLRTTKRYIDWRNLSDSVVEKRYPLRQP